MSDSDSTLSKTLKLGVNTKKLIGMVRDRPCLWDRASIEYKNRVFKNRAWKEICSYFEPNYETLTPREKYQIGTFITKKWCNIRDSYVKSKKPVRMDKRPYVYAEDMGFLDIALFNDPHTGKKRKRDEEEDRMSNEEGENEPDAQVTWIDEVFVESDHNMDQSDVPLKRVKLENEYPKGVNDIESIASFLENVVQREDDEDRAFFKSITPAVKRLSEDSKLEFKILVMKLLKNLRTRDRQGMTTKREKPSHVDSESE